MFKGWRDEDRAVKETEDYLGREEETKSKSLRIPAKNVCKEWRALCTRTRKAPTWRGIP